MKHTPGPWFAIQYGSFCSLQIVDAYNEKGDLLNEEDFPNAEANAKLAAAAPDLLEALITLKNWVGQLEDWKGEDPPCEIVDAVIKQATE